MNETTKESKFLAAINKYAEKQKQLIGAQVEEYKAEKIEQATESGLQDAYELIQRDIAERKAAIVTEYARKEYALKKELYAERQRITDTVFAEASEKLLAYTDTEEYRAAFFGDVKEAAAQCADHPCVMYVRDRDRQLAEEARTLFTQADIQPDAAVMIGGFRVLCEELGILIDCTLDERLNREREQFYAYSELKVVDL